jgi:tetratricopeptide (TPR) repeat protein
VVNLELDLRDLVARGLVHHDTGKGRFDLHPIVRRYAYDRLGAPDRAAAHTRLRDYFAAVPPPEEVTRLEDLAPVIELYHHTVRAGQLDEARTLFRDRLCPNPLYFQLGAYQLIIDLLRPLFADGEDRPPRLEDETDQAWTLNVLANSYSLSGQPRQAVPLFEQQNAIQEKQGDKRNLAIGLGNVALAQMPTGALRAAEGNLRRRIALCRDIKDEFIQAVGHEELGRLLAYRGAYAESEVKLATALKMSEQQTHVQGQGLIWADRALRELLRLRQAACGGDLKSQVPDSPSALALARDERDAARQHAQQAHRLATCDGPPDYTYHAAYAESAALLAQLG